MSICVNIDNGLKQTKKKEFPESKFKIIRIITKSLVRNKRSKTVLSKNNCQRHLGYFQSVQTLKDITGHFSSTMTDFTTIVVIIGMFLKKI